MPVIELTTPYPLAKLYWKVVRKTMKEVFGADTKPVRNLRKRIRRLSQEAQLLFYHSEPLDVVADLVGRRPTKKEVSKYLALKNMLEN